MARRRQHLRPRRAQAGTPLIPLDGQASCGVCEDYAGGMCFQDEDSPEFVNAGDSPCPAFTLDPDVASHLDPDLDL